MHLTFLCVSCQFSDAIHILVVSSKEAIKASDRCCRILWGAGAGDGEQKTARTDTNLNRSLLGFCAIRLFDMLFQDFTAGTSTSASSLYDTGKAVEIGRLNGLGAVTHQRDNLYKSKVDTSTLHVAMRNWSNQLTYSTPDPSSHSEL